MANLNFKECSTRYCHISHGSCNFCGCKKFLLFFDQETKRLFIMCDQCERGLGSYVAKNEFEDDT